MNDAFSNAGDSVERDYLARSLIQAQWDALAQCERHQSRSIAPRPIIYTGFTALRLTLIETPLCPRLADAVFHVSYTDCGRRPKRLHTQYLKLPDSLRSQPTVTYRRGEVVIACTSPLVTWAVLVPHLTQVEVIVLADAIIRAGARTVGNSGHPITKDDMVSFLDTAGDFPGAAKCRAAIPFITVMTDSAMECRTLLALLRHGLPYPSIHGRIRIPELDRTVTVDLMYGDAKVIVEYDGDAHRRDKRQHRWDERKRQALRAQGYTVIVAFADDVLIESGRIAFAHRVAQALGVEPDGKPLPPYCSLLDDDRRARDRDRQRLHRARRRRGAGTGRRPM